MNIAIALNGTRSESGKIPQGDKDAWRDFNGSFRNVVISPEELAEKVKQGFAYTAQHRNYRNSKYFQRGQHSALDFDNGVTLSQAINTPFFRQFALFVHTTPSHTPESPRLRVVFALDRPISDKDKYAELSLALTSRFGSSDASCKDPARFFYGAKGCEIVWFGHIMTLEEAAAELVFPHRKAEAEARKQAEEAAASRIPLAAGDVPDYALDSHRNKLLARVRTAPDGEKYFTLRNTAITFGGYVAGEYYPESRVIAWLKDAIRGNPNNVISLKCADDCIEESVAWGKLRPLQFEIDQKNPIGEHSQVISSSMESAIRMFRRGHGIGRANNG